MSDTVDQAVIALGHPVSLLINVNSMADNEDWTKALPSLRYTPNEKRGRLSGLRKKFHVRKYELNSMCNCVPYSATSQVLFSDCLSRTKFSEYDKCKSLLVSRVFKCCKRSFDHRCDVDNRDGESWFSQFKSFVYFAPAQSFYNLPTASLSLIRYNIGDSQHRIGGVLLIFDRLVVPQNKHEDDGFEVELMDRLLDRILEKAKDLFDVEVTFIYEDGCTFGKAVVIIQVSRTDLVPNIFDRIGGDIFEGAIVMPLIALVANFENGPIFDGIELPACGQCLAMLDDECFASPLKNSFRTYCSMQFVPPHNCELMRSIDFMDKCCNTCRNMLNGQDMWTCFTCTDQLCGVNEKSCVSSHYEETKHRFFMSCDRQIWDQSSKQWATNVRTKPISTHKCNTYRSLFSSIQLSQAKRFNHQESILPIQEAQKLLIDSSEKIKKIRTMSKKLFDELESYLVGKVVLQSDTSKVKPLNGELKRRMFKLNEAMKILEQVHHYE